MSGITVLFLAATVTSTVEAPIHRYLLAVGVNRAIDEARAPLRYADDDAARFFEMLAPGAEKAFLLTELDRESRETFASLENTAQRPDRDRFESVVRELEERIRADRAQGIVTELHYYYSGHGDVQDAVGYVHLADRKLTRPEFKTLLLERVQADRTHVIVDACKSYLFVAGRGPGGKRERQVVSFAGPEPREGVGYVLSTSDGAESHEWSEFSGGIFSHEIRSALTGGADADGNGEVDYGELAAFVAVANSSIPFPKYRPKAYIRPPPAGDDSPVISLSSDAAVLELELVAEGRFKIVDERGLRYADVNKARGMPLNLRLVRPFRYDVLHDDKSYNVDTSRDQIAFASLAPTASYTKGRSAELHKAFTHLFETPFDASTVRGYRLGVAQIQDDRIAVIRAERDRESHTAWGTGTTIGGLTAIVGATALIIASISVRNDIADAPQVDRPGLAGRADGLAVAGGISGGIGLGLVGVGLYLFSMD